MPRCSKHRVNEPCHYCNRGVQPFTSTTVYFDALEERFHNLELRVHGEVPTVPDDIDLREAVAVIRDYALGDIVMLSAGLQALKKKNPERPLVLVTCPELYGVLAGADYLDAQLPKSIFERTEFFKRIDLCHAVETEAGGRLPVDKYLSKSRPDNFADLLGVEGGAENFPIPVDSIALGKMQTILEKCKRPLIGLAATCNSPVRTIPPEYVKPLVEKIGGSRGGTVVLLGKTTNWSKGLASLKMPGVVNLVDTTDVRELIAAISLLDVLVSPDSGSMHIAGALGVKCLCLMGNNNPKNFSDFYPSVKVLQPDSKELPCVPCNDRSIACAPLPKGQYGAECMRLMTPERVSEAFRSFYNGKNIAYMHDTSLSFIGGAEITTKGMIKAGREMGYNIRLFDKDTPVEQLYGLYGYDLVILSNIWRFSEAAMRVIMQVIRTTPYIKYEHDHDGLGEKALGKWPKADYAEQIYGHAALNVFVSPAHKADYAALGDGICIPELIDTEMFKPVKGMKRQPCPLIPVPGKWSPQVLKDYLVKNPTAKVLTEKVPHAEMPALYSNYETLAHFPERKWPCDRVIFEAALCGCKVVANGTVEALSWEKDLTDTKKLRAWLDEVPGQFWQTVGSVIEGKHDARAV